MSRMKMDDIVFGRSMREPGYRVDFAAGTTYSLDLETFISLPFSLGFLEDPDEAMKKSLTYVFAALRLCSDRLAVFCNFAGHRFCSAGNGRPADNDFCFLQFFHKVVHALRYIRRALRQSLYSRYNFLYILSGYNTV